MSRKTDPQGSIAQQLRAERRQTLGWVRRRRTWTLVVSPRGGDVVTIVVALRTIGWSATVLGVAPEAEGSAGVKELVGMRVRLENQSQRWFDIDRTLGPRVLRGGTRIQLVELRRWLAIRVADGRRSEVLRLSVLHAANPRETHNRRAALARRGRSERDHGR